MNDEITKLHDTGLRRAVAEVSGFRAEQEDDGLWGFYGPYGRIPAAGSSRNEDEAWEVAYTNRLVPEYQRDLNAIVDEINEWGLRIELYPGHVAILGTGFSESSDASRIGGDAARLCRAFLRWHRDIGDEE
jgi:hypothetical protein